MDSICSLKVTQISNVQKWMSGAAYCNSDGSCSCGESGCVSQWLPCGSTSATEILYVPGSLRFHGMFSASRKRGGDSHSTLTHCLILTSAVCTRTQSNHSFLLMRVWRWTGLLSVPVMAFPCRKTGKPPALASGLSSNPTITSPVFQTSLMETGKEWTDSTENKPPGKSLGSHQSVDILSTCKDRDYVLTPLL